MRVPHSTATLPGRSVKDAELLRHLNNAAITIAEPPLVVNPGREPDYLRTVPPAPPPPPGAPEPLLAPPVSGHGDFLWMYEEHPTRRNPSLEPPSARNMTGLNLGTFPIKKGGGWDRQNLKGQMALLNTTNPKLAAYSWSITEGLTCPGRSAFCHACYAARDSVVYKNAADSKFMKLRAFLEAPEKLERELIAEINEYATEVPVRIHVSGDFFSVEYVEMWTRIVAACDRTTFWAYTRSWRIPELLPALNRLRALPNINMLASFDPTMEAPPRDWRWAGIFGDPRLNRPKTLLCPAQVGAPEDWSALRQGKKPPLNRNNCRDCGWCWTKAGASGLSRRDGKVGSPLSPRPPMGLSAKPGGGDVVFVEHSNGMKWPSNDLSHHQGALPSIEDVKNFVRLDMAPTDKGWDRAGMSLGPQIPRDFTPGGNNSEFAIERYRASGYVGPQDVTQRAWAEELKDVSEQQRAATRQWNHLKRALTEALASKPTRVSEKGEVRRAESVPARFREGIRTEERNPLVQGLGGQKFYCPECGRAVAGVGADGQTFAEHKNDQGRRCPESGSETDFRWAVDRRDA